MAYSSKYKLAWTSVFLGDTYAFYIHEEGYGGSESNAIGTGNPLTTKWHHTDENNKFKQVLVGSTCKVRLMATSSQGQYDELFTTDSRKYKGILKKNGTTIWTGYGLTENYARPDLDEPLMVEVTFSDQLGSLKDIDFNENETFGWGTQQRLSKIVGLALYQTDLNLPVYEAINIYETNMDSGTGDSFLYQTYMYPRAFKGLSCYEVLERILKGSRLIQRNGAWWIVRIDEMKDNTIYYRKWDYLADMMGGDAPDSDSTEDLSIDLSQATAAVGVRNVFSNHSQFKEWKGGWKEFTLKSDNGYNGNLIKDYEDFTAAGGIDYSISGDKLRIEGVPLFDNGKYILYNLGNVNISNIQRLKVTIKGKANSRVRVRLDISSDSGEYYYMDGEAGTNGYTIFRTPVYYVLQDTFYEGTSGAGDDVNHVRTSETFKGAYGNIFYGNIEPFPADVYLTIFAPYGTNAFLEFPFEDFKVEIISDTYDYDSPSGEATSIGSDNNIVPSDMTLYPTDGTSIANDTLMFDNIMYYNDGSFHKTSTWSRRGNAENLRYALLLMQEIVWQYNSEWIKRTGELICHFDMMRVVSDGTSRFMIASDEWDVKFDKHKVMMLQIGAEEEYILFEDSDIMELETGTYVER